MRLYRCILICCLFTSVNAFAINTEPCNDKHCAIIVDVGSTGSRVYLYHYVFTADHTPTTIENLYSFKHKPGLANVEAINEEVSDYLDNLFGTLVVRQQKLPVYFYATAGMRLLSDDQQQKRYQLVKQWFSHKPQFELKSARTITGPEEALFAWTAANYHAGTFNGTEVAPSGVMDFGGASTQVAFTVGENESNKWVTEITIAGHLYRVYARSFLGLGLNEVSKQYRNEKTCFPLNYRLPDGEQADGNLYQCEQEIIALAQGVHHASEVKNVLLQNQQAHWFGLGALGYLRRSKPFEHLGTIITLDEVGQVASNGVCHFDWEKLHRASPNDEYLYDTCLASSYYNVMMVNSYGLSSLEPIQTQVPGQDSGWSEGVLFFLDH